MGDEKARAARFMAQFELSKKSVAGWPDWMRANAKVAVASFPESKMRQNTGDVKSDPARKK